MKQNSPFTVAGAAQDLVLQLTTAKISPDSRLSFGQNRQRTANLNRYP